MLLNMISINHYRNITALFYIITLLLYTHSPSHSSCLLYTENSFNDVVCLEKANIESLVEDSYCIWFVQFYSSVCGHCIAFAPHFMRLATDVKNWHNFLSIGVMNCADTKVNERMCSTYRVPHYPAMKIFKPYSNGVSARGEFVNPKRKIDDLHFFLLNLIIENTDRYDSKKREYLNKLIPIECNESTQAMTELKSANRLCIMILESQESNVGREILLDISNLLIDRIDVTVRRISIEEDFKCSLLPSPVDTTTPLQLFFFQKSSLYLHYAITSSDVRYQTSTLLSSLFTTASSLETLDGKALEELIVEISDEYQKDKSSLPLSSSSNKKFVDGSILYSVSRQGYTSTDILNSISYSLRTEIPTKELMTNEDVSALLNYLKLLQHILPQIHPKTRNKLTSLIDSITLHSEASNNMIKRTLYASDWSSLVTSHLDNSVFPVIQRWVGCRGSKPYFRGYTCGLWVLFHLTLTQVALENSDVFVSNHNSQDNYTGNQVALILREYVVRFFTCTMCRIHFTQMSTSMPRETLSDKEAVLWYWIAHNKVNERLKESDSTDPMAPKIQFPSTELCPNCKITSPIDKSTKDVFFLNGVTWNKSEVFLFLLDHYDRRKYSTILYSPSAELSSSSFLPTEFKMCLALYVMVFLIILLLIKRFYSKRSKIFHRRKLF